MTIQEEIKALCRNRNAIIMAHYYQPQEIQEVADFIGDSLALAQQAAKTNADVIVMCGVHFMAETAKILCPEKTVLIPEPKAGCSLADSCQVEALREWKKQHPGYKVISYVNTSAAVKAETDIVVTSSNALKIVSQMPENEPILFGPDKNLGRYISVETGRQMALWDGCCHVHSRFDLEELRRLKALHPDAQVLAHPECPKAILDEADLVGSTAAILAQVKRTPNRKSIIVTEPGVIYEMRKACPEATLIPVGENLCEYMRMNTLEKLRDCLRNNAPQVEVEPSVSAKARICIDRMLALS